MHLPSAADDVSLIMIRLGAYVLNIVECHYKKLVQQLPATKSHGGECWTHRSTDTPKKSEDNTICPHSQPQRKLPSAICVPWAQGPRSSQGQDPSDSCLSREMKARCQEHLHTWEQSCLFPEPAERKQKNRSTGVLTHRPTGGSSHCQKQQDKLTPETTWWWEISTGSEQQKLSKQQKLRLLGIIRAQFSHQCKFWISKHNGKARFIFKNHNLSWWWRTLRRS